MLPTKIIHFKYKDTKLDISSSCEAAFQKPPVQLQILVELRMGKQKLAPLPSLCLSVAALLLTAPVTSQVWLWGL